MENYKKHLSNIIDLTEEQWAEIEKFLVVKHIKKNEFILEEKIPFTTEFESVTLSINSMINKIEKMKIVHPLLKIQ